MDDFDCEGYGIETVPKMASSEEITGITIKGKDMEYLEAQKMLKSFMKNKGERFLINGIEMEISDTPKNRPMIIGIKPKAGMSGKSNLKFFDKNNRGGATIMIQKAKGGDSALVKILGIKVIKHLLDCLIEGKMKEEELQKLKIKSKDCPVGEIKCKICGKEFRSEQGYKGHVTRMHEGEIMCEICPKTFNRKQDIELHMKRVHVLTDESKCVTCGIDCQTKQKLHLHMISVHEKDKMYCEVCRVFFKGESEFEKHQELEHSEIMSPKPKKRKHEREEEVSVENIIINDVEMAEVNDGETVSKILEKQNDEKVLMRQQEWFEKEVRFQEMKRKMSEKQKKTENKRKRQSSIRKRKDSEAKMLLKDFMEENRESTPNVIPVEKIRNGIVDEKETTEGEMGPGYMGWNVDEKDNDKLEKGPNVRDVNDDVKSLYSLYLSMEAKLKDTTKQVNSLKKDVKHMEDEYKQCMNALANETYERNKADDLNKVLLENIEAAGLLKVENNRKSDDNSEEDMSVDEIDSQAWIQQKKLSTKRKNKQQNCDQCNEKFKSRSELDEHNKIKHMVIEDTDGKCDESFSPMSGLESHKEEIHAEKSEFTFKCNKCDEKFTVKEELRKHLVTLHAEKVFNCQKCNKPYPSMNLLRRHDWRCHREIECTMCGETLQSREDIKGHRERKHQIFQRTFCKFFPSCIDGDECLFEHVRDVNEASHCPNGQSCDDQTCKFSEQKHSTIKVLCKFQTNCNRLNCPYTHSVERKAFLGEGLRKILRN